MSLLTMLRHRACPVGTPIPTPLRERIQLSADLVVALLELEGRDRPTLDDLEWADAVAFRLAKRRSERELAQAT